MVEQGWGRIVTIVSDAGRRGERFQAIYGAAKAGAMGFMRGVAAEVGAHGVTANCVALGTMKTGVTEEALAQQPRSRGQALPAVHDPAARAARAIPPCSSRSCAARPGRWITGQVYPVDGGYAAGPVDRHGPGGPAQ